MKNKAFNRENDVIKQTVLSILVYYIKKLKKTRENKVLMSIYSKEKIFLRST